MRFYLVFIALLLLHSHVDAQYAPQAGLPGSTAILATGGAFTGWATQCTIHRGYRDIAFPVDGVVTLGDSSNAIGAPDGGLVSLGDSGIAVLTFSQAIYNGTGPDFAVFENGFPNPADPSQAFLELAFVEVSSDGVNFFRFPANSNTQTSIQIPASGVYMDASLINNLAGKYIGMYGTPFDLQELAGNAGLDIDHITHVRLVDVVGSLGGQTPRDVAGHVINDPYPTDFASGGFDLDAVGAIHQYSTSVQGLPGNIQLHVFPNPATDKISIRGAGATGIHLVVSTLTGQVTDILELAGDTTLLSIGQYPAGMYYFTFSDGDGNRWMEKIVKY